VIIVCLAFHHYQISVSASPLCPNRFRRMVEAVKELEEEACVLSGQVSYS